MAFDHWVAHGAAHAGRELFAPVWEAGSQGANNIVPVHLPEIGEIIELGVKGFVGWDVVELNLRSLGAACNVVGSPWAADVGGVYGSYVTLWNGIIQSRAERPKGAELREIANRQLLTPEYVQQQIGFSGVVDPQFRRWMQNLQYDIPGPADLVRFSVRHCWEPDLLEHFGYADEFPGSIIDVWHAMKGLDYPLLSGPFSSQIDRLYGQDGAAASLAQLYVDKVGSEPTWAKFYWYSHWVLPSPTQGYLAWQRLSPDRNTRWDAPEMVGVNFSYDDLNLLLRANDYPPYYRPILAAISHPIPGIRFAREFYTTGVYSVSDLFDWAKRQGYADGDALDIARDISGAADAKAAKPAACKLCGHFERAYEMGVLDESGYREALAGLGQTPEQVDQAVQITKLDLSVARARQVVSAIRTRYLSGELTGDQAQEQLISYGLVAPRVVQYMDDWQIERTTRRRTVSASQAVKWACQGLISLDDLNNRLVNLSYAPADVRNLMTEAVICQANLAAKAAQQAAQAQAKSRRAAQQAIKAQQAALKQLQQQLASHGSPSQLRKWFCEGHIGDAEVFQRLEFLGWPSVDIYRFLGDCKSGREPAGSPFAGPGQTGQ